MKYHALRGNAADPDLWPLVAMTESQAKITFNKLETTHRSHREAKRVRQSFLFFDATDRCERAPVNNGTDSHLCNALATEKNHQLCGKLVELWRWRAISSQGTEQRLESDLGHFIHGARSEAERGGAPSRFTPRIASAPSQLLAKKKEKRKNDGWELVRQEEGAK